MCDEACGMGMSWLDGWRLHRRPMPMPMLFNYFLSSSSPFEAARECERTPAAN